MKLCPIFISSSDSYSDLWPIFFDLFVKYWPEFQGKIYLNTESKTYTHEGLDLCCTQVGHLASFGQTFRAGIDTVDSDDILLIMIDYFFMGDVKSDMLEEYFRYFKKHDLDSLCLIKNPYTETRPSDHKDLFLVIPPSQDMFNFQIAFWKKTTLYDMVLPHESPWLSEWYGTLRANRMKIKLFFTIKMPIEYLAEGALHKGKWVKEMMFFLNELSFQVDYDKRGVFKGDDLSLLGRTRKRLDTLIPRIKSQLDLIRRRSV
jgi:hypothetical protein